MDERGWHQEMNLPLPRWGGEGRGRKGGKGGERGWMRGGGTRRWSRCCRAGGWGKRGKIVWIKGPVFFCLWALSLCVYTVFKKKHAWFYIRCMVCLYHVFPYQPTNPPTLYLRGAGPDVGPLEAAEARPQEVGREELVVHLISGCMDNMYACIVCVWILCVSVWVVCVCVCV